MQKAIESKSTSKEENTSHSFSRGGNTDQIDIRDNDMIIYINYIKVTTNTTF